MMQINKYTLTYHIVKFPNAMMEERSQALTKRQAIDRAAIQITDSVELEELTRQVLTIWPSVAKNP
jgi:hypothetical protein